MGSGFISGVLPCSFAKRLPQSHSLSLLESKALQRTCVVRVEMRFFMFLSDREKKIEALFGGIRLFGILYR